MWKQIFRVCFKTIKDNDLIWMQYRVLYRILGTKNYCLKLKAMMMPNAVFVNNTQKRYLFVACKDVKKFWSDLKTHL